MKYFNLYRVSSYLLIFFAFTHTVGGLLSKSGHGKEADAVLSSMKAVHFDVMCAACTYYDFYFGFGISVSVFFLFSAFVAWFIGGMKPGERRAVSPLVWALFISYLLVAVISRVYFFIAPGVTATIIAVLLGISCVRNIKSASQNLGRTLSGTGCTAILRGEAE